MTDISRLVKSIGGLPRSTKRFDNLAYEHVIELAETNEDFRQKLIADPKKALHEIGMKMPEFRRLVVLEPGDHVISLVRRDARLHDRRTERRNDISDAYAENAGLKNIFQLELNHYSSSFLPTGHRGDDELRLKLPASVTVQDVTLTNTDVLAGSDASLTGFEVVRHELVAKVHWWFNGWMQAKYSLKVLVDDPQNAAQYEAFVYDMNSFLSPPATDYVPSYPNYHHAFNSYWDFEGT